MAEALFGILGIIAGAVVAGVATGALTHVRHRTESRVAARILHGVLSDACKRFSALYTSKDPGFPGDDWSAQLFSPWEDQRVNLARAIVSSDDFREVANAFSMVSAMVALRQHLITEDGVPVSQAQNVDEAIVGSVAQIDAALPILARASLSHEERRAQGLIGPLGLPASLKLPRLGH